LGVQVKAVSEGGKTSLKERGGGELGDREKNELLKAKDKGRKQSKKTGINIRRRPMIGARKGRGKISRGGVGGLRSVQHVV